MGDFFLSFLFLRSLNFKLAVINLDVSIQSAVFKRQIDRKLHWTCQWVRQHGVCVLKAKYFKILQQRPSNGLIHVVEPVNKR